MIEEITLKPSLRSVAQQDLFALVYDGLRDKGVRVYVTNDEPITRHVACWGWRGGAAYRSRGHEVLVFERGYLGDRFEWTSIGWNGLNGYADFCLPPAPSPEKFERHFELKPWRTDGEIIIIMGQVRGDASLRGSDLTSFYEVAAKRLTAAHKKPVFFRPHPAGNNFAPNIPVIDGDLQQCLKQAALVVTFNSNSAVDAVINGIPAIAFDKGSMAWDVTSHTVEEITRPDREQWAHALAHCQYSPDEIKSGAYWERVSNANRSAQ